MATAHEMEILFPTNYSDSCYQVIPGIAQLAASMRVRITIFHAYDSGRTTRRDAEDQLHSFFAEAAHYCDCRRVVAEGPAHTAIGAFAERHRVDLIFSPAADRFGLPRLGHKSLRARLVESIPAPLWTLGARVKHRGFAGAIRSIACRMAYGPSDTKHIKLAAALATRLKAQLHLIDMLPNVDEGTLVEPLYSNRPLSEQAAIASISGYASLMKRAPAIHVAPESGIAGLRKLLEDCEANMLFLGHNQALRPGLWGGSLERLIDSCGCPVVAADGAAIRFAGWNFAAGGANMPVTSSTLERGRELISA